MRFWRRCLPGGGEVGSVEYLVFGEGFDDFFYGRAFQLEVRDGVGEGEVGHEAVVAPYAVNPSVLLVVFDEGDCVKDIAVVERYVEPGGDQIKEIVNAPMVLLLSSDVSRQEIPNPAERKALLGGCFAP